MNDPMQGYRRLVSWLNGQGHAAAIDADGRGLVVDDHVWDPMLDGTPTLDADDDALRTQAQRVFDATAKTVILHRAVQAAVKDMPGTTVKDVGFERKVFTDETGLADPPILMIDTKPNVCVSLHGQVMPVIVCDMETGRAGPTPLAVTSLVETLRDLLTPGREKTRVVHLPPVRSTGRSQAGKWLLLRTLEESAELIKTGKIYMRTDDPADRDAMLAEWADVLQTLVNTATAFHLTDTEIEEAMAECRERNRKRGRL